MPNVAHAHVFFSRSGGRGNVANKQFHPKDLDLRRIGSTSTVTTVISQATPKQIATSFMVTHLISKEKIDTLLNLQLLLTIQVATLTTQATFLAIL